MSSLTTKTALYESRCPNCTDKIREGDTIHPVMRDNNGVLDKVWVCHRCTEIQKDITMEPTTHTETSHVNTRRLNRPQIRVFLQMMGLAFNRHGGTVAKLAEQAKDIAEKQPVRANEVYDMIVSGSRPQGVQTVVEESKLNVEKLAEEVSGKIGFKVGQLEDTIKKEVAQRTSELFSTEAAKYQKLEIKVGHAPATKMKVTLPKEFEKMVKLATVRQNILLIGPSGSGKTFLAAQLATALKLSFGMQSCSAGISESQLTGWLLPVSSGGAFGYVPAGFVEAFENGGVFLLDEIDAADAQILMIVNAALANESMVIPQRFKKPMVKRHKDFVCIAAANTFGHGESEIYSGREMLDGATLDRFRAGVIFLDYSDVVEEALVDPEVLKWGRAIRNTIKIHKLERIMSTRVMLDFTKQKQMLDFTEQDWNESYFCDWAEDEKRLATI